jgi:hypothetical protein
MSGPNVFGVARSVWDHPRLRRGKKPFSRLEAWIWLLSEASWRPRRVRLPSGVFPIERGQLAHSIRFMATAWKWETTKVVRFLNDLKTDTMIATETATGITVTTICNYDKYQVVGLPYATQDATPNATETQHERNSGATNKKKVNRETGVEARKRATRLPDNWVPSSEDQAFAKALGFSDQQIKFHADKFRDFWRGKAGAGGTKLDWPATWRNWMRSEDERRPKTKAADWRNPLAGIV